MLRVLLAAFVCLSIDQVLAYDNFHPVQEFLSNFNLPALGNGVNDLLQSLGVELPGNNNNQRSLKMDGGTYNFTKWTSFGKCSKVCGGGSRARTRACVNATGHKGIVDKCFQRLPLASYDLYKIIKYGTEKIEIDEELCNKHECQVSEWELDESCSKKCGGGFMTYSRGCFDAVDQNKCNFQSTKLVSCNTKPCFRLGEWQEWSRCTAPCGMGQSSRKRSCEPNVPPYSPLYQELMYAMEHVTKPSVLRTLTSENEVFFFSQYLSSCASQTVQTKFCNQKPCPYCPQNQIFHTCKPCTRICKKIDHSDLFNLKVKLPKIHMNPNGCGGICSPGCGCSPFQPLLSRDGKCYQADLLCSENHLSPAQTAEIIIQLVAGKNQRRSTLTPALGRNLVTSPTTTLPATTTPTTTVQPQSKALCPKDIPILEHDFCVCAGILQVVKCVAKPHQRCPVICKDLPVCPNKFEEHLKSAPECSAKECSTDDDCEIGRLCCELRCGKRCFGYEQ